MSVFELFENYFWLVAEQSVQIIVPLLVLVLIFKIVYDLILRSK